MTAMDQRHDSRAASWSGGWLLAPAIAVVAVGTVMGAEAGFSATDDLPVDAMLEKLEDARGAFMVGGGFQALAAMGMVIFGAWIFAWLRSLGPDGSLIPAVAAGGCVLTAATMAVAAAHTQLGWYDQDAVDAAIPLTLHTLEANLFAGAWGSLALVAGAVAVAALRHRVLPVWFGGVSAFIAVLLVVLQVAVPWAGWFPATIWLITAGFGLRARRASIG